MLTNLLRPEVVARLVAGLSVSCLLVVAVVIAVDILLRLRVARPGHARLDSELQLSLERRTELLSALVSVGLGITILNALLTLFAADRLSDSVRGAMCAFGVFAAGGWWALCTSVSAALLCGLWLVLHRIDLSTERSYLTRTKLGGLLVLAPLCWLDLWLTARWLVGLDMQVVSSCCSVGLDRWAEAALGARAMAAGASTAWAGAAAVVTLLAFFVSARCARRPSRAWARMAAVFSLAAAALALPAIALYVAPHAYETPRHLCPFCLLRIDEAGGIGWPLLFSLALGTLVGLSLTLLESLRRVRPLISSIENLERRLCRWSAAAWLTGLGFGLAPVVRYAWLTGGASVFG